MQKLEKGMLRVGTRFAEQNGACCVVDIFAIAGDCLSVGLHGELLEVSRKTVHVLVVWSDKVSLSTEKVGVPDTQQAANDGNVFLQRCLLEVLVHRMAAGKELMEVLPANVYANAEANGAPDAVSSTHPVREREHVLLVNAKFGD